MLKDVQDLKRHLHRLEGKAYPAYKDLARRYRFPGFDLIIDHIQGDPYAAPSRMRARVPLDRAGFDRRCWSGEARELGVCSYLARLFAREAAKRSSSRGTGKSGQIFNDRPGQEVLSTTAVLIIDGCLEARFFVGLPAAGRRILGRQAADILCMDLPRIVEACLFAENLDEEEIEVHADCNEDADALRKQLPDSGLAGFVADGAVLPRRSGIDQRPLVDNAIPFRSPESLRVEFDLPHAGPTTGMGIPVGVTLIVGGGFHGKSTLLNALERGVYNHLPGDGRERVVADATAVKIRAEDGRSVAGVDISPFINRLPQGIDTAFFSTQNASGSTSQAANILEALEAGTKVLLLDEDTSATNFMIRDQRMQELIAKDDEPITPFLDKVRQLWEDHGVSTILVMGGSGDYFEAADTVIAMRDFQPHDVTDQAREIAARHRSERLREGGPGFGAITPRAPLGRSLDPRKGKREESVKSRGVKTVLFGREELDLTAVEQIVHPGQLRAVAAALLRVRSLADGSLQTAEILDLVEEEIRDGGLDVLSDRTLPDLAGFRRIELAAALNRLRTLKVTGR